MSDENETEGKIPVHLNYEDHKTGYQPRGWAKNKREAARVIREFTGDNAIRAADIEYSSAHNFYYVE